MHCVREAAPHSSIRELAQQQRTLRGSSLRRELLLNAQQIVHRVQNGILPPHEIPHPQHALRLASVHPSDRPELTAPLRTDDRQTLPQLRPLLREQLDRLGPPKRARRQHEPFLFAARGWGQLKRKHVRPRDVPHVYAQRRPARRAVVACDGASARARDQRVYVPVRALCGRVVYLAGANGPVDVGGVDGRDVDVWVRKLEGAHGLVGEALGDAVDVEAGRAGLERVLPR